MNHEINDNVNKPQAEVNQAEALFLKVHEGDKDPNTEMVRRLEQNEREIAKAVERIAELAKRTFEQLKGQPEHLSTMMACATDGAAANEPAYKVFLNHLC